MKISVDGGGLCTASTNRFGNYIFSFNLIKALGLYDKSNQYFAYTFCQNEKNWPKEKNLYYRRLWPKFLWMKLRVTWEEVIDKKEIFFGLNQAVPFYTTAEIIAFCHGLSYFYFPHFYRESYVRLLTHFKTVMKKAEHIVVSSVKVREELKDLFPRLKNIVVIPYGIPFDMLNGSRNKFGMTPNKPEPFFLFVGMNHPIKNVDFLIKVFLKFIKEKKFSHFQLYLVGDFEEYIGINQSIVVINRCDRTQLRQHYQKAIAYLTASFYESFNLPVLEALSQGCPVVGLQSAIIPEFKSYVNMAKNEEQFFEKMKLVVEKKNESFNIDDLRNEFSWKNYIKKLLKLY